MQNLHHASLVARLPCKAAHAECYLYVSPRSSPVAHQAALGAGLEDHDAHPYEWPLLQLCHCHLKEAVR